MCRLARKTHQNKRPASPWAMPGTPIRARTLLPVHKGMDSKPELSLTVPQDTKKTKGRGTTESMTLPAASPQVRETGPEACFSTEKPQQNIFWPRFSVGKPASGFLFPVHHVWPRQDLSPASRWHAHRDHGSKRDSKQPPDPGKANRSPTPP